MKMMYSAKMLIAMIMVVFTATPGFPASKSTKVVITKLNVAPLLGAIKDAKDLFQKFDNQKDEFANYLWYDLNSVGLSITKAEAEEITELMANAIKKTKEVIIDDGTNVMSMGWRSKTGRMMRTGKSVLRLGRGVAAFPVKIKFKDYDIEYIFLKECGNIALLHAREFPPCAEEVPKAGVSRPVPRYVWVPGHWEYQWSYYGWQWVWFPGYWLVCCSN